MQRPYNVATRRGSVLNGVLFTEGPSDTVLIAITGIHGNFYSNPFYYVFGEVLNAAGMDFLYAQTNDAFGQIRTTNTVTGQPEIIGSWNERFAYTEEDIDAYLTAAVQSGYRHIILAGHSLGANKVIYYLSRNHDPRVEHFLFLSPANIEYMMSGVTAREREIIRRQVEQGDGDRMLPFPFMGWVTCIANTAWDWAFSGILNNVHTGKEGDWSQLENITHSGGMLIGTYDNFTDGDPDGFLREINSHMPKAAENRLFFIEKTGHTYQMKHQETAEAIRDLLEEWRK